MTRKEALAQIWRETHRDFKGKFDGQKCIMVFDNGSRLVALDNLTDAQIASRVKGYEPEPEA